MNLYKQILQKLIIKNVSISVAESCTGGLLSSKITSVPGVSKIYNLGWIVYSNNSKTLILKIPKNIILKYGSVSKEVIDTMIKKLYNISKSDLCICTTGIAGPTGATKNKPVGLVYIGIKYKNKNIIIKKKFRGTRKNIQNKTVKEIFSKIKKLI